MTRPAVTPFGVQCAQKLGARLARAGMPYHMNPYPADTHPELHLAWSTGHNAARAAMLQEGVRAARWEALQ